MKKIFSKIQFYFYLYLLSPLTSLAVGQSTSVNFGVQNQSGCPSEVDSLSSLFTMAVCILQRSVWPLLIAIATIVFITGVVKYVANGDDSTKREEGRNFMIYGIVGLFVMVSVWALVRILTNTFGFGSGTMFIPQLGE